MDKYCANEIALDASSSTRLEDLSYRINEICELSSAVENSYNKALVRNLGVESREIPKETDDSGLINLMLTRMNYIELVLKSVYTYLERV
jgi:hypothetical protein